MKKLFFSPGPVPYNERIKIDFSHRSEKFEEIYKEVERNLKKKFHLDFYNIIFIQGSGTAAIETVLKSIIPEMGMEGIPEGTFGRRARLIRGQRLEIKNFYKKKFLYYVQFETSRSLYRCLDSEYKKYDLVVVDCVSGLGFYDLPKADIIIASSSKILGGLPVMGLVFYNNKARRYFLENGEYLNIQKYIEYANKYQTPHTALLPQFISLNQMIGKMITRKQIVQNCALFQEFEEYLVGEKVAPVLTFKTEKARKIVNQLKTKDIEVYFNSTYMRDSFQVSMFSYKELRPYKKLHKELRKWL